QGRVILAAHSVRTGDLQYTVLAAPARAWDRSVVRVLVAVALLALLGSGRAAAQIATGATPVHHGKLDVRPATGSIDRSAATAGQATIKIRGWKLELSDDSNGIYPDKEPMVIAFGDNNFRLPAGALVAKRHGRLFRYRAPRDPNARGIRFVSIVSESATVYRVTITLVGLDLSDLLTKTPICYPTAVIIGDDDGFSGPEATTTPPVFKSRHLIVPKKCTADPWPWA